MSDPRPIDSLRRLDVPGAAGRAAAAAASDAGVWWTTLWTWLAAVAAAVVILGLVFGYSRIELAHNRAAAPATDGSAPAAADPRTRPR